MDLLFKHNQIKRDKKNVTESTCDLKLFSDNEFLTFYGTFNLGYCRYGTKKQVIFEHVLNISLINGDVNITYRIINDSIGNDGYKTSQKNTKNNFKSLNDLIENCVYKGEKRLNFWGVKYDNAKNQIISLISDKLNSIHELTKPYKEKPSVNQLYDIIVDFHLTCKNIKGHDNVYFDIMDVYPSKKFLKQNDNKFLPSVLDSLKIKTNYFIKELNISDEPINLIALNYLCKLFGDNYLEYVKKINWKDHCMIYHVPKMKVHPLKNDTEKKSFLKLINRWDLELIRESVFEGINTLLKLRNDMEKIDVRIELNPKNGTQYNGMVERLTNLKQYHKRGYKVRYTYPEYFVDEIQKDIELGGVVFKTKLLITEEDFINEGVFMKNCMSKQFNNGILYVYLRGSINTKHINIQYRRGKINQSYGKSNSKVPELFQPFIEILTEKFKDYRDLVWVKEKYEFINKS